MILLKRKGIGHQQKQTWVSFNAYYRF